MSSRPDPTITEAQRLLRAGQRESAFRLLSHAIRAQPRDAELWYWIAMAADDRAQSRYSLRRALALKPDYDDAREALAALKGATVAERLIEGDTGPSEIEIEVVTLAATSRDPATLWPDRHPVRAAASTPTLTAPFPLESRPGAPFPPQPVLQPVPPIRVGRRWLGAGGLLALLLVAVLCSWAVIRNASLFFPGPIARQIPAVATAAMRLELRSGPPPTVIPQPEWVTAADTARLINNFELAETLLAEGLAQPDDRSATLAALARLYGDLPGREQEARDRAVQALETAQTVPQRAVAAETLAWGLNDSAELPELPGIVDQLVQDTPNSPHAQWALAFTSAKTDPQRARDAAALALHLDRRNDGSPQALDAALLARLGDRNGAIQQYDAALKRSNYAPWHAALAALLIETGQPEAAQPHLDALRRQMPDHPLLRR